MSRRVVVRILVGVVAVLVAAGLYWFEPWRLVTNTTVDDALAIPAPASAPAPAGSSAVGSSAAGSSEAGSSEAGPPGPAGPVLVARGTFVTHEHETTGEARVVRHPDGRVRLELVGLSTSDGPDLRVWLSDQPVRTGPAGWTVFDDGRWVELGELKGNRGNQVYDVPAGTDLTTLTSVTIWCKRFGVSFGAAALRTYP